MAKDEQVGWWFTRSPHKGALRQVSRTSLRRRGWEVMTVDPVDTDRLRAMASADSMHRRLCDEIDQLRADQGRLIRAAQQWRDTDGDDEVAMYLACYALQEALMEDEDGCPEEGQ